MLIKTSPVNKDCKVCIEIIAGPLANWLQ